MSSFFVSSWMVSHCFRSVSRSLRSCSSRSRSGRNEVSRDGFLPSFARFVVGSTWAQREHQILLVMPREARQAELTRVIALGGCRGSPRIVLFLFILLVHGERELDLAFFLLLALLLVFLPATNLDRLISSVSSARCREGWNPILLDLSCSGCVSPGLLL